MMKQFILLVLMFFPIAALGQSIAGRVTDASTGEPLIGATVVLKSNPQMGASTDGNGNFELRAASGTVLLVSYLGYIPQEITVGAQTYLNIILLSDSQAIESIVVVGYGTQRSKDLTAPIAVVGGDDLSRQITSNPMGALQGKVAGVQVINNGAPGAGATVKIRGVGSIGDYAKPLYVVDGAMVDNIDFLSSGDIETMSILKDASASAIYGVRAANGVVLITTRRGAAGRTRIVYDGYAGVQVPVNIVKLANREQYVELLNLANNNIPGYIPKDASNYPTSTDWYAELVRPAAMQSHSVDVSGATYSVGIGYLYQDGIMRSTNNYDRINLRGRFDERANDWLKVGMSAVVANSELYSPNEGAVYGSAYVNPPVYPVYNDANTEAYPYHFDSPQRYGFGNSYGNPVATARYNNNRERGLNLLYSTYAEVNISDFVWRTAYNLSVHSWDSQNYTPAHFVGGSQGTATSRLSKTFGLESKQVLDNTLTWTRDFGRHHITLLAGQSTRIEKQSTLTGSALNVPGFDEASIYLKNGSFKEQTASDGGYLYHGLSGFVRAAWNYADKYLATITMRADGSSKYQQHWGYFPSVGLGWVLSKEEFGSSLEYLKLRASWGMLGNDNVPANSSYILGDVGMGSSGVFGDALVDGMGAQTVYRNRLQWEVVDEWNIGVDARFFKDRLSVEADFYYRTTYNVVFNAPIATGGGATELLSNNGTVRNRGIELTLGWDDKIGHDWNYHIGMNLTTIDNSVLALNGRSTPIPGGNVNGVFLTSTRVGYPIGGFWGYEVVGVYRSEVEALADPVSQTIKDAGFFKYKDQNDDNVINDEDITYLGSPIPKLMGGLDFGISYKGWDLSISLQGQAGGKIFNAKRMNRNIFADGNYDLDFYEHTWRMDAKSNTYPSPEAFNTSFIQRPNSFFVEDASYIRIQNVQLSYTFNNIAGLARLRLYIAAQRPLTLFSYNGFSPEIGGSPIDSGIDRSVYPMSAIYTIGANITF